MDELEYLEANHSDEYDKAIVFIHGWKGNKDSFTSLSSILNINFPLYFLTYTEVNAPVIACPMCIGPDGDGAKRMTTPFFVPSNSFSFFSSFGFSSSNSGAIS